MLMLVFYICSQCTSLLCTYPVSTAVQWKVSNLPVLQKGQHSPKLQLSYTNHWLTQSTSIGHHSRRQLQFSGNAGRFRLRVEHLLLQTLSVIQAQQSMDKKLSVNVEKGGYCILAYLKTILLLTRAIFNQLWVCTCDIRVANSRLPCILVCVKSGRGGDIAYLHT